MGGGLDSDEQPRMCSSLRILPASPCPFQITQDIVPDLSTFILLEIIHGYSLDPGCAGKA
jgi:hypothetical protein